MDLLRSLPLGLYLEQPITGLHRLDPRVKIAWLASFLAMPILANSLWRCVLVGVLIGLTLIFRIPLRVWGRQMGWLLLLSTLVLLITMLTPDGLGIENQPRMADPAVITALENGTDVSENFDLPPTGYRYILFERGPLRISQQSLGLGIRVSSLIFTLIYSTNLFLLTTAPEEITAALEDLLSPLRLVKWPVTEIALTTTLALRFIPLVLEEVQNLVRSIRTRAINWKKLGFRGATQIWMMLAERLLENLLLRAEQISAAMAVRGFTSPDQHRVLWHNLRFTGRDSLAILGLGLMWLLRWIWGQAPV